MKILVVEDDAALRRSLAATLELAGMVSICAATGRAALSALQEGGFAAIILDIGLPDIDGFEILAQMRKSADATPVVMLTARDAVRDRVAGLNMGADDYVLKPFEPDELLARLHAVMRRQAGHVSDIIEIGALRLMIASGVARVGDRMLDLRPREWAALTVLASRPGRTVSRELLAAELFPDHGEPVAANVLDVHVGRLRRKLQPDGPRLKTLKGLGFRLEP